MTPPLDTRPPKLPGASSRASSSGRIADDDVARLGEGGFDLAGYGGIEPRKYQLGGASRRRGLHRPAGNVVRQGLREAPGRGVAKRLALRTLTGAQPLHLEPRMIGEE